MTNQTKKGHSPTPWKYYWFGNRAIIEGANGEIIVDADDKGSGDNLPGCQSYGIENEANAALIVRAVNNFDALCAKLEHVERWMSGYGTKSQREIHEEVREALRLAKEGV